MGHVSQEEKDPNSRAANFRRGQIGAPKRGGEANWGPKTKWGRGRGAINCATNEKRNALEISSNGMMKDKID